MTNWFGVNSEFNFGALRVTVQSVNTDSSPATVIMSDQFGEHHEMFLGEALHLYRTTYGHDAPTPTGERPDIGEPLEHLSERQVRVAHERAGHVREVLYGDPTGVINEDSDPQYDPARSSLNSRIQLKSIELEGVPGYSVSSLHRLVSAYQDQGTRGLAPYVRDRVKPQLTEPVNEDVLTQIYKTLNRMARTQSTMTLKACLAWVIADLEKAALDASDLPHHRLRTIVSEVREQHRLRHTARSRRSLQSRSPRGRRRPPPSYPGEQIEIDSTQLNVMVKSPTESRQIRPWVIAAVCVLTRIAYIRLTPTPPTSRDVRLLLWEIYGPLAMEQAGAGENLPLGAPGEVIVPERTFRMNIGTVVTDHGREFENTQVIELLARWGCDISYARTSTGSDKAYVESFNRTLDLFQQHLPGYVGQGPEHRAENIEGTLTYRALEAILKTWLGNEYLHRPHSSLHAPNGDRGKYLSPAQAYELAMRRGAALDCHLTTDDIYVVLDSAPVTVSSDGVRCDGLKYDGPSLHRIKSGELSPVGSLRRKLTVRYDPNDRSRIFHRDDEGRWHVLYAIDRNGITLPPFSDSIASEIKNMNGRRLPSEAADVRNHSVFMSVIEKLARENSHRLDIDRIRVLDTVPDPDGTPSTLDDDHVADQPVKPVLLNIDDPVDDDTEAGDLW